MKAALWPLLPRQRTVTLPWRLRWDSDGALRTTSWPKRMTLEPCTSVFSSVRIHRQSLPSFVKVWQVRQSRSHVQGGRSHDSAAKTSEEVGQGSLDRFFPGFTEDSAQQATFGAGQSGVGCKRSVNVARPAHLGVVIAARSRIKDMVRDAATAGLIDCSTTTSGALG